MSDFVSIRMRASRAGMHISGAERIIRPEEAERASAELVRRALTHPRGVPDSVTVTLDSLAGRSFMTIPALTVSTLDVSDAREGRSAAVSELTKAGIPGAAAREAINTILGGAAMRGAMVMDARTGERLEGMKGVRARAFDYHESAVPELQSALIDAGLENSRMKEALCLATKASKAPGVMAELCISDDPEYVTGYIASPVRGYVRITRLKEKGSLSGGRVFFIDPAGFDFNAFVGYMRETPVFVTGPFEIS